MPAIEKENIFTIAKGTTLESFQSSNYCISVDIFGDSLEEINELITVRFDPITPDQFSGFNNVTIVVSNDDCKLLSLCHKYYLFS